VCEQIRQILNLNFSHFYELRVADPLEVQMMTKLVDELSFAKNTEDEMEAHDDFISDSCCE
jgi:hypothetical protein